MPRLRTLAIAAFLVATLALYLAGQRSNPPGFFFDEASIAYNALTIARSGADEHGVRFPLYFEALGEWKNPIYIYLLAATFKVLGPSALLARRLSAILGWLAAAAMSWLAWRRGRSTSVALITFGTVLVTPMLFEISRLAFEVAVYPLAIALFLLAVRRAYEQAQWDALTIGGLSGSLVLLTYAYSIGRLLAPLLFLGLWIFATRERLRGLLAVAAAYALFGIAPLVVFNARHDGALTKRFDEISYLSQAHGMQAVSWFIDGYLENLNPAAEGLEGDSNGRHHVRGGGGGILCMSYLLAVAGAIGSRNRYTAFLLYGTAASLVPASLTNDLLHALRLVAFPLFLIALSIEALIVLQKLRWPIAALLLIQPAMFLHQFVMHGQERLDDFDVGVDRVIARAIEQPSRPICTDRQTRPHALWLGALRGVPADSWRLCESGVFVSGGTPCDRCEVLARAGRFTLYARR